LVKENPIKKTNQKDLVKTIGSKSTCPKWYFGQIGHGGKENIYGGFVLLKFLVKKTMISCSGVSIINCSPLEKY
jgi:hypothetical protein